MSKGSNRLLFFYQGNKLITVNQGDHHRAIFRSADIPLGEQKKIPSIQIEIYHPRKPSEPAVNLLEKPGNTRNYKLEPKTHNSTFHRETLYIIETADTKEYIAQYNLSEYVANDIEIRQLNAHLSANGHNPPLSPSVSKYLRTEIKSRTERLHR